jgi:hypothetical protein
MYLFKNYEKKILAALGHHICRNVERSNALLIIKGANHS